jgi:kelch-like protein 10
VVDLLVPREFHGTAVVGFNIFIVGGFDSGLCLKSCYCFNAVTKTWRKVAPMNCVRSEATH